MVSRYMAYNSSLNNYSAINEGYLSLQHKDRDKIFSS